MSIEAPIHRHSLQGCRPEPLGSYLKALGVFRLIAEQTDPEVLAHWDRDALVVETTLDEDRLRAFFLNVYAPTPLLTPWNNSSGFGREGVGELGVIEASTDPRLAPYRVAIAAARQLMSSTQWAALSKEARVAACRAVLPDASLAWVDAAVVLTDGRAVFPPLLGTGGNDGRLEFSRNFHQRVLDVLGMQSSTAAATGGWLVDALDATRTTRLMRGRSPGQFDGGSVGGPNSAPTGAAESLLNPWDWVLLIEGSLMFASGAARRLAAGAPGQAAAPFTVGSSAVGYPGSAVAESTRGELWLPLWDRPARLPEIRRLFGEGRADWRRRHVRTGLEFAEAVADLAVDRGITAFSRHGLLERNGLATVATPLGRIATPERSRPGMDLLRQVEELLLDPVRRAANLPARAARALRRVEEAAFAVASGRGTLLEMLIAVGGLHDVVARSSALRVAVRRGPISLDGDAWAARLLEEGTSAELRLAISLASACDRDPAGQCAGGLRDLLMAAWSGEILVPPPVPGLGLRALSAVLADAHRRRVNQLIQSRRGVERSPEGADEHTVGVQTLYGRASSAPLGDVNALVIGAIDESELSRLLGACLLLRIKAGVRLAASSDEALDPALCLLGPFYAVHPAGVVPLRPEASWPATLASGRVRTVVRAAVRRLQMAGWSPVVAGHGAVGEVLPVAARRLGAALLVPLGTGARAALLERSCPAELGPQQDAGTAADPTDVPNPIEEMHVQT